MNSSIEAGQPTRRDSPLVGKGAEDVSHVGVGFGCHGERVLLAAGLAAAYAALMAVGYRPAAA